MPLAVVYIDELAALNFTVDYLLLSAAAALSSVYASRLRRMAGALVGAAYACLAFFLPRPLLAGWAGKSACAGIMVLCAFGYGDWRRFARRCLMLSVCGALFAGFALLLGGAQRVRGGTLYADMPGIVVLALCTCAYILVEWILHFSRRTGEDAPALVRIEIEVGGKRASFSAMRDTGNRLREPLSGLPVLIVSSKALPTDFGRDLRQRRVRYGALGGSGEMPCYRPDQVLVRTKRGMRPSPNVWVAVYPGAMPGRVQALAPGCMAQML